MVWLAPVCAERPPRLGPARSRGPIRPGPPLRPRPPAAPGRPVAALVRPALVRPALADPAFLGTVLVCAAILSPVCVGKVLVIRRRRVAGRQPLQALPQVLPLAPLEHRQVRITKGLAISW